MSEEATETPETEIKTEGTVRHNKELLDELKKARDLIATFETDKANREADEAKKRGDYEELLKKEQEKSAKSKKDYDDALSARDSHISQLLTDHAVSSILSSVDVRPELKNALTSYIRGQATMTDNGVLIGGKSADEFSKEFFATDEGKAFLRAVVNSGGGATGNTGTTPVTPDTWSLTKFSELKAVDQVAAAAYAKKHGKNF